MGCPRHLKRRASPGASLPTTPWERCQAATQDGSRSSRLRPCRQPRPAPPISAKPARPTRRRGPRLA
eukprot:7871891-Lingulodinium_polyedra.AAC.1